jgi:ectoine hydroxylase-related dioxygenase (phytanoyl-CoA dioxygenase family)
MSLVHLSASATIGEARECMDDNGYVIIDELASPAEMDQVEAELRAHLDATGFGQSDATGRLTKRTGALIARSPSVRRLIMNPLVLGIVDARLSPKREYQISLTEIISLYPGAKSQFIHRDELAFGAYPFDNDFEVQVSTLWALTDYTEEMGATRVVPGSHRLGSDVKFELADTVSAEMSRGSILIYSGKLYHGGGQNTSQRVRRAINIDYALPWLRQEENQYLSCPANIARTLPPELLVLMGYHAIRGHGRVGDWGDPLSFVLGGNARIKEEEFGDAGDIYKTPPAR